MSLVERSVALMSSVVVAELYRSEEPVAPFAMLAEFAEWPTHINGTFCRILKSRTINMHIQ